MSNVILDDLTLAAGTVVTQALNALPFEERKGAAQAMNNGCVMEVRIRPQSPRHVALWMHDPGKNTDWEVAVLQET